MGKFRLQFIGRSDNCPKYPSGKDVLYQERQRPADLAGGEQGPGLGHESGHRLPDPRQRSGPAEEGVEGLSILPVAGGAGSVAGLRNGAGWWMISPRDGADVVGAQRILGTSRRAHRTEGVASWQS